MSTAGGYHEYTGGDVMSTPGGYHDKCRGRSLSTLGDIMINVGEGHWEND